MRSEISHPIAVPPWARWTLLALGVAALATLASINGLWNGFTYDDRFIILGNPVVQDFRRSWVIPLLPYWPIDFGGDGYRPLTLFAFAAQWKIAPGSAFLFPSVSV